MPILPSLRMLRADFTKRKLLIHSKRDETSIIRIDCCVMHRILYKIRAVDTHSNRLSLASEIRAKFLLALDEIHQKLIIDSLSASSKSDGIIPYSDCALIIDDNSSLTISFIILRGEEIIVRNLTSLIALQCTCNTCCRPEIRTVGIIELNLDDVILLIVSIKLWKIQKYTNASILPLTPPTLRYPDVTSRRITSALELFEGYILLYASQKVIAK